MPPRTQKKRTPRKESDTPLLDYAAQRAAEQTLKGRLVSVDHRGQGFEGLEPDEDANRPANDAWWKKSARR